jgi:hypothetical protein
VSAPLASLTRPTALSSVPPLLSRELLLAMEYPSLKWLLCSTGLPGDRAANLDARCLFAGPGGWAVEGLNIQRRRGSSGWPVATGSYVELLLERVRDENFPNPDRLDRIEAAVRSPEQRTEYALVLLSKVQRTRYPSGAILDRLGRLTNLS